MEETGNISPFLKQDQIILIVEDDAASLGSISAILEGAGFRVLLARSGESALEKAQQEIPDLILMAVQLPGINGFETYLQLKAKPTLSTIPIIFMATSSDTAVKVKDLQTEDVDFITEPFQYEEVLAHIRFQLMDHHLQQKLAKLKARLTQEENRRQQVEQDLLETRTDLENRVAEQTLELKRLQNEIAECKLAEKTVRLSEEHYRFLYEDTPSMYFMMDVQGLILSVNRFGAALLGYRVDELIGNSVGMLIHPEDQAFMQQRLAECLEKPASIHHWELRQLRKDGSLLWVKETLHGVLAPSGSLVFLVVCQDITEKKREEQVREVLYQIANAAISIRDINDFYRSIHLTLGQLMPAQNFFIALHDPSTNMIHFPYFVDQYDATPSPELCQNTLISYVIQTGRALLASPDVQKELVRQKRLKLKGTKYIDWLGVPLQVENRIIGIMAVLSHSEQIRYGEEESGFMEFVSTQVAMAIERKKSFDEIRQHLQRMNALHVIDVACTNNLGIDLTLGILIDQVMDQLKVDAANIFLYSPETKKLEFIVGRGFRGDASQDTPLRFNGAWTRQVLLEREPLYLFDISETAWHKDFHHAFEGEDIHTYFGAPIIANAQVKGILEVYHRSPCQPDAEWLNFLKVLSTQAAIAIDNANMLDALQRSNQELMVSYDATLEGWSYALELRDGETEGHARRVTTSTLRLARALKVKYQDLVHLRRGALLHDIGKMGIPDQILLKAGPLNDSEWNVMRQHPLYAYQMLAQIPYLRPALDIPYRHHERWDGSGYPGGLKGEEIPLAARIFAVIDVWDALSNDRPYRKAWKRENILNYIQEQSGKQFDPQIASAFLNLVRDDPDR